MRANWRFGEPYPSLYFDPRIISPELFVSFHAQCMVVDDERALVGSANFINPGQTRNIEAGVLLHDAAFARQLAN